MKEKYFKDEIDITVESINIKLDIFQEDFIKEFNEKAVIVKKYFFYKLFWSFPYPNYYEFSFFFKRCRNCFIRQYD
jgi:hypothetical protein